MGSLRIILASLFAASAVLAGCTTEASDDDGASGEAAQTGATTLLSPTGETPLAPNVCAGVANGTHCGASLPGADASKIYFCYGGETYTALTCPGGCKVAPQGIPDACVGDATQHVVVSLRDQRLRAYAGNHCVRELPISSGKPGFETTLHGNRTYSDFAILAKVQQRRMKATINGESYDTDGVPWDVQLTDWGIYFHGAFWSNPGGSKGNCGHCGVVRPEAPNHGFSHGCINERIEDARWLYLWLPPANASNKIVHVTEEPLPAETCDGGSLSSAPLPAGPSECFSTTLQRTMPAKACVQAKSDRNWYRCDAGNWTLIAAPDGSCTSQTPLP